MGLKELRDVKLQIRELLKTHLNGKHTHNTAATCPAGQSRHHAGGGGWGGGGEKKQNSAFLTIDREVNIMEAASNIPERHSAHIKGCLCSKSVRFGINGLQRGLDTHAGTHTHTQTFTCAHTHTHTHRENPLPQFRLIRFTTQASKALQCRVYLFQ